MLSLAKLKTETLSSADTKDSPKRINICLQKTNQLSPLTYTLPVQLQVDQLSKSDHYEFSFKINQLSNINL